MFLQSSTIELLESLHVTIPDVFYPEDPLDTNLPIYSRSYLYVVEYTESQQENSFSSKEKDDLPIYIDTPVFIAFGSIGIMSNSKERLENKDYLIKKGESVYQYIDNAICLNILSKKYPNQVNFDVKKISVTHHNPLIPIDFVKLVKE